MSRTAVLVPCYKRSDYTELCIVALEEAQNYEDDVFFLVDDGSNDKTAEVLSRAILPKKVTVHEENKGLRNILIDFIEQTTEFEYLSVVGNDCLMPRQWLNDVIHKLETTDADILSPNVNPSNAAYQYGRDDNRNLGYRPAQTVGGLWTMRRHLVEGIFFERVNCTGIVGAFQVLRQIIVEKRPRVGWLPEITVEDVGHWSGLHPKHVKSHEHKRYSVEIGRRIAW